nr:hypothetical protein [Tanacetum cinerariifolium]
MWESVKTAAPTPSFAIIQLDVDDNFVVNTTHLNMIRENKFDGDLLADSHDHIHKFFAICNKFRYCETQKESSSIEVLIKLFNFLRTKSFSTLIGPLNLKPNIITNLFLSPMEDIRNKYNELREGNASKNHQNDDMPMCERHEANYIQYGELNNDVKNDLEHFKRCIHSMRIIHDKLFASDDGKITGGAWIGGWHFTLGDLYNWSIILHKNMIFNVERLDMSLLNWLSTTKASTLLTGADCGLLLTCQNHLTCSLDRSLPKLHGVTKKLDTLIVAAYLCITFVFEDRDDVTESPLLRHLHACKDLVKEASKSANTLDS